MAHEVTLIVLQMYHKINEEVSLHERRYGTVRRLHQSSTNLCRLRRSPTSKYHSCESTNIYLPSYMIINIMGQV